MRPYLKLPHVLLRPRVLGGQSGWHGAIYDLEPVKAIWILCWGHVPVPLLLRRSYERASRTF